jgi:hypothetical protein
MEHAIISDPTKVTFTKPTSIRTHSQITLCAFTNFLLSQIRGNYDDRTRLSV